MSVFPENDAERAKYPIADFIRYFFPNAIAALARHSYESQQKHSPGTRRLTWNKDASIGDGNQLMRHFMDDELEATAWRALELLERKLCKMPPFGPKHDTLSEDGLYLDPGDNLAQPTNKVPVAEVKTDGEQTHTWTGRRIEPYQENMPQAMAIPAVTQDEAEEALQRCIKKEKTHYGVGEGDSNGAWNQEDHE